jgi:signal transduction histidine kinase
MSLSLDREKLTRRLRALFGLTALLVLVSVIAGIAMLTTVTRQFGNTVEHATRWTPRIERYNQLGASVSEMGGSATNLFVSKSAKVEREHLEASYRKFQLLYLAAAQDLAQDRYIPPAVRTGLTDRLNDLAHQAEMVSLRTNETIGYYESYESASTTRSIALTSFHLTEAQQIVADLVKRSLATQSTQLAGGHRASVRVKLFALPLAIAGAGAVITIGVVLRILARRLTRLAIERESMLNALERSTFEAQEFTRRLAESNRDLTDFAHVASHDLQEPLRKIIAFGSRLEKRCGEQLGDDGREYLDRMQNAAVRMQTLIDDLLMFSRVTTRGEAFVPTDLRVIVDEVLSDLEVAIETAGASIEIGPLPHIEADPSQLRQIMQNLIGNALKFKNRDTPTMITIEGRLASFERSDDLNRTFEVPTRWWDIQVKDNGIGFEQKYAEKIFTVFQRLHGRSDYEGSGIGLSVCRRIAERHRGLIHATSEFGKGSTFTLTLPESHGLSTRQIASGTLAKHDQHINVTAPTSEAVPV